MDNIIYIIIVGGLAGFLASLVIPNGLGLIGTIIVGIVGGIVGGMILGGMINIGGPLLSSILTAAFGAIVFLLAIRLVKKV